MKPLADLKQAFLTPANPTHRQYEALRAYFVERLSSRQAAQRFGYSPGSFRILCTEFRKNPERAFFLPPSKGPKPTVAQDTLRQKIVALRKKNLSIYDISRALGSEGVPRSAVAVSQILKKEGFAKLPRRQDEERLPGPGVQVAPVANIQGLDLTPRRFRTQFGGLFLFLPYLAQLPLAAIVQAAALPGSTMIPAQQALLSLLGLKLYGTQRHSHVMSYVLDQGPALFAGLNTVPKRSFLTEYSCRIHPGCYAKLMTAWFDGLSRLGLERGTSFDLDFHTIPFHGEEALLEKHYVSKRSRRQKGILAFLAHDADQQVFCYANAQVRKENQNDEILQFIRFWKKRTGQLPQELIFDSKLTTYANLSKINDLVIDFITLRRRSEKLLQQIQQLPSSAWRRIEIEGLSRIYKTPRILDQRIQLKDYDKPLRQIIIADLGHEEPTLLITNQLHRSASKLIERYAKRMIIENQIANGVNFFHMDALSSAVPMKVDCDLQLTLMASSLYRLLGTRLGNGYQTAKADHLFRDFVEATALVTITDREIQVKFQKRAHNPLLRAAGFTQTDIPIPWLESKHLRIFLGEGDLC